MTPEVAIKKRATVEATKVDTSTEAGGAEATPKTAEKVTTEKSRNVASATTINLVSLHAELHSEYVTKGTQRESAVNLHARVVDELAARNVAHPAPPFDSLDDTSTDFEATAVAKGDSLQPLEAGKEIVEKRDAEEPDPYMNPPTGPQPFTVHQRWIGKSVRSEFRAKAGDVALCWLLDTEIAKANVPVTTLKLARAIPVEAVSAINWGSGEWQKEPVAKRADPTPVAWLDVEAATAASLKSSRKASSNTGRNSKAFTNTSRKATRSTIP
jgi:hypothetical protein